MTQGVFIGFLLGYILVREGFFLYSTHKFVNKIMSHNFHDYQQSLTANKTIRPPSQSDPEDLPEDLGSLEGLGIL